MKQKISLLLQLKKVIATTYFAVRDFNSEKLKAFKIFKYIKISVG